MSSYPDLDELRRCVVCNTDVSESQLVAHRMSTSHLDNFKKYTDAKESSGNVFPANVCARNNGYTCLWCSKYSSCVEMLEAHLRGKDHSKRCANSDIPLFGEPGHYERVAEYVDLYGHDPYARFTHWPAAIVDAGSFWTCTECKLNFHTQRSVNEHVRLGHKNVIEKISYPIFESPADPFISRELHECLNCLLRFSTDREMDNHYDDLNHLTNWVVSIHDKA